MMPTCNLASAKFILICIAFYDILLHVQIFSGLGIATLGIGMVVRLLVSFFAVWGTNLNMKERLFIPFAWLPKATVQVEIFLNP